MVWVERYGRFNYRVVNRPGRILRCRSGRYYNRRGAARCARMWAA